MSVKTSQPPPKAEHIKTYAKLTEIMAAFVSGQIRFAAVHSSPGLGKSRHIRKAIKKTKAALYVSGRKSAIRLYCDLYDHADLPVVLDDCDEVMENKQSRDIVRALTDSEARRTVTWDTKGIGDHYPTSFGTSSPVCVLTNHWDSRQPIMRALESRAELFHFCPDWAEVYRYACRWLTDQEILDYVYERLPTLVEPDCRVLVKAKMRKNGNFKMLDWREPIEQLVDDADGLVLRRLLADKSFKSNSERAKIFCDETGRDRATFYRRMAELRRFMPERLIEGKKLPRIVIVKPKRKANDETQIPGWVHSAG